MYFRLILMSFINEKIIRSFISPNLGSAGTKLLIKEFKNGGFSPLKMVTKQTFHLGDSKPLVTSQSPEKVIIQIALHQRLQKRK